MPKIDFSGVTELAKHSVAVVRQKGLDRFILYGVRYLWWKLQFDRAIRSLPTSLATGAYLLIRRSVTWIIKSLRELYPNKYTDADPYKLIHIDPSSIEYTTGKQFSKRRGWVVGGEWDEEGEPFMQRTVPKAIEQRFVEGLEWEETTLANRYDKSTLEDRGVKIDQLYRHIRDDGYKSQRQLLDTSPKMVWNGLNDAMHPLVNEIAIDIGRDGELLWNMWGQHRLAIARVLEIDRIPVQVFRRHAEWQTVRDRVRRGEEIPAQFRDHPDLTDLE